MSQHLQNCPTLVSMSAFIPKYPQSLTGEAWAGPPSPSTAQCSVVAPHCSSSWVGLWITVRHFTGHCYTCVFGSSFPSRTSNSVREIKLLQWIKWLFCDFWAIQDDAILDHAGNYSSNVCYHYKLNTTHRVRTEHISRSVWTVFITLSSVVHLI